MVLSRDIYYIQSTKPSRVPGVDDVYMTDAVSDYI